MKNRNYVLFAAIAVLLSVLVGYNPLNNVAYASCKREGPRGYGENSPGKGSGGLDGSFNNSRVRIFNSSQKPTNSIDVDARFESGQFWTDWLEYHLTVNQPEEGDSGDDGIEYDDKTKQPKKNPNGSNVLCSGHSGADGEPILVFAETKSDNVRFADGDMDVSLFAEVIDQNEYGVRWRKNKNWYFAHGSSAAGASRSAETFNPLKIRLKLENFNNLEWWDSRTINIDRAFKYSITDYYSLSTYGSQPLADAKSDSYYESEADAHAKVNVIKRTPPYYIHAKSYAGIGTFSSNGILRTNDWWIPGKSEGSGIGRFVHVNQMLSWDHDMRNGHQDDGGYNTVLPKYMLGNVYIYQKNYDRTAGPISWDTSVLQPSASCKLWLFGKCIFASHDKSNQDIKSWLKGIQPNSDIGPRGMIGGWYANSYMVRPEDVGNRICQWLKWEHRDGKDKDGYFSPGYSIPACYEVPYHYENGLTITSASPSAAEITGVVRFKGTIMHDSGMNTDESIPSKTTNLKYKFVTVLVKGDGLGNINGKFGGEVDYNNACPLASYRHCELTLEQSDQIEYGKSNSHYYSVDLYKQEKFRELAEPGDYLCSSIVLNNYWKVINDIPSNTGKRSNFVCTKVGKKPQIHIAGADVVAGKDIKGSSRNYNIETGSTTDADSGADITKLRGSYSQYGVIGNAEINDFGSNSFTSMSRNNAFKSLIFANKNNNNNNLGSAGISLASNQPNGDKGVSTENGNANQISADMFSGIKKYANSIEITGGKLGAKASTIYVNGTVTITGNIEPSDDKALEDLSNLTIVAKNIIIAGGVQKIYANLYARNSIDTCTEFKYDGAGGRVGGTCEVNPLHIYGSLSAPKINLHRTFGGGAKDGLNRTNGESAGAPAEWIDYSPLSWLAPKYVPTNVSSKASSYTTTTVNELPARL